MTRCETADRSCTRGPPDGVLTEVQYVISCSWGAKSSIKIAFCDFGCYMDLFYHVNPRLLDPGWHDMMSSCSA